MSRRRSLPGRALRALRRRRAKDPPKKAPEPKAPPQPRPRETATRLLERGRSLDHAVIAQARSLIAAKDYDAAQSIAESLRRHEETQTLGRLAGGMVALRRGFVELAWEDFRDVPREAWTRFTPGEYVRAGLAVAPEQTLEEVRALVADDPPDLQARGWYRILAPVFGLGAHDLARELFAIFDRHVREDAPLWPQAKRFRKWLRPWIAGEAGSPSAPGPGRRGFAILDYGHPSAKRASANIGDYIQSIAALGHLARHQGVRLQGQQDLVEVLTELRERTRPELRLEGVNADLEVMTVHRDASTYEHIPEDTWVLAFGWFMHSLFRMRHCFPLHRNLRPIFVSFHCNKRALLTPEAKEYLRRYGPIGCRDWTTVYLLQSAGIPAFFSGCLTTTVDAVVPEPGERPGRDAPIAYVDMPPEDVPADAVTYAHSGGGVKRRSFARNARAALDLLDTYRGRHRRVVTSRLHCYLPARSMGLDVDFRPGKPANVRFDGLAPIDDRAFDQIRQGLLTKLERVLEAIVAGRPESEVYALWREITAPDVAAAEERARAETRLPPPPDVEDAVRSAVAETVTHGPTQNGPAADAVHCAVVFPKGGAMSLSVLVASLLEHTSRPLHVWLLGGRGARAASQELSERFPQAGFSWVPTRKLDHVRLLLPELLPGVDRLVLLPLPAVATGDVAELADLDLGGHALAAPTRPGRRGVSGFAVINAAATRLGRRTGQARELRRSAYARHAFDFDAFTSDVLVLDLARLRREGFSGEALSVVEGFGLDEIEALHYLVGPDRAAVPEAWALVPTRAPQRAPGLVHWADRVKPWQPELTPGRELWRRYARSLKSEPADRVPAS